jgi:hypothetical protein
MQFGEYAMGSECGGIAADVVEIVRVELGLEAAVEEVSAGERGPEEPWCRVTADVKQGVSPDDPARESVRTSITDAADSWPEGVMVRINFTADSFEEFYL